MVSRRARDETFVVELSESAVDRRLRASHAVGELAQGAWAVSGMELDVDERRRRRELREPLTGVGVEVSEGGISHR